MPESQPPEWAVLLAKDILDEVGAWREDARSFLLSRIARHAPDSGALCDALEGTADHLAALIKGQTLHPAWETVNAARAALERARKGEK